MLKVDLVCPIYKNVFEIKRFCEGLKKQKNIEFNNIVFPHTLCGDDSIDNEIHNIVKEHTTYQINISDFSHSLTRENAIKEHCSEGIVILCSQDIILKDENALSILASCINDKVVVAFSRQATESMGIEKYTREYNYPNQSYIMSKDNIEKDQIKTFFSSDACAAYNRDVYLQIGGYDSKVFQVSEDMYYCRKAILAGYCIMYCSESVVIHSHDLTIKQLYERYYNIGIFFSQNSEFKQYKSTNSGFRLAIYILFKSICDLNFKAIIRWLPDMAARYLGKKKGEKLK